MRGFDGGHVRVNGTFDVECHFDAAWRLSNTANRHSHWRLHRQHRKATQIPTHTSARAIEADHFPVVRVQEVHLERPVEVYFQNL